MHPASRAGTRLITAARFVEVGDAPCITEPHQTHHDNRSATPAGDAPCITGWQRIAHKTASNCGRQLSEPAAQPFRANKYRMHAMRAAAVQRQYLRR